MSVDPTHREFLARARAAVSRLKRDDRDAADCLGALLFENDALRTQLAKLQAMAPGPSTTTPTRGTMGGENG